ncbi:hypothetical protein CYMTET_32386 [Cymbomonas tetramitiformis]|uniref:Uncharacterized protein n=1 Tax=Cymbomonas tetramitiformis TaxID=36881 RepID=A0AAE0KS88_9CHLO|nr:hypothetical protein CYMTET_32386 [Cymbomonas tetramitiformis]
MALPVRAGLPDGPPGACRPARWPSRCVPACQMARPVLAGLPDGPPGPNTDDGEWVFVRGTWKFVHYSSGGDVPRSPDGASRPENLATSPSYSDKSESSYDSGSSLPVSPTSSAGVSEMNEEMRALLEAALKAEQEADEFAAEASKLVAEAQAAADYADTMAVEAEARGANSDTEEEEAEEEKSAESPACQPPPPLLTSSEATGALGSDDAVLSMWQCVAEESSPKKVHGVPKLVFATPSPPSSTYAPSLASTGSPSLSPPLTPPAASVQPHTLPATTPSRLQATDASSQQPSVSPALQGKVENTAAAASPADDSATSPFRDLRSLQLNQKPEKKSFFGKMKKMMGK